MSREDKQVEVIIGGLQKLTLLDYPGKTACTIFLAGCNFRCPFCHNAPLVLPDTETAPTPGQPGEEEVLRYLKKRRHLLDGVCLTGGEPLLQDAIFPFLEKIKNLGYDIKLDTNGSLPHRLAKAVHAGLVDYVAMDIKNSRRHYARTSGIPDFDPGRIDESIRFLQSGTVDYEFRTTVVKGIHKVEDINQAARWIQGAKRYYLQNFVDSGDLVGSHVSRPSSLAGEEGRERRRMEPFSKKELASFLQAAKQWIPNTFLRGESF